MSLLTEADVWAQPWFGGQRELVLDLVSEVARLLEDVECLEVDHRRLADLHPRCAAFDDSPSQRCTCSDAVDADWHLEPGEMEP